MADFTKTISNNLNLTGPSEAGRWGENWGTMYWTYDPDLSVTIGKWLAESISHDSSVGFDVGKWLSNTMTLTDVVSKYLFATISAGEITPTSDITRIILTDANGYTYIIKGVGDVDDQVSQDYTEQTAGDSTYVPVTASSSDWTEV